METAGALARGSRLPQVCLDWSSQPTSSTVRAVPLDHDRPNERQVLPARRELDAAGPQAGSLAWSSQKAVDAGLAFRPLAETARDTLAWFRTLPAERQATLRAGLAAEREAEVLAAWREAQSAT